jgi:hypothetical protein
VRFFGAPKSRCSAPRLLAVRQAVDAAVSVRRAVAIRRRRAVAPVLAAHLRFPAKAARDVRQSPANQTPRRRSVEGAAAAVAVRISSNSIENRPHSASSLVRAVILVRGRSASRQN